MQQVQQMQQQVGYFCGVPGKAQNPADIIEIVDRSNGTKMVMVADGRTG
jgi:hypothetical protein